MKTQHKIVLNDNEKIIIQHASKKPSFTLGDLIGVFRTRVKAPNKKGWKYAQTVNPDARTAWLASLASRNGMRRLVREKLVRKVKPGTYKITPLGMGHAVR